MTAGFFFFFIYLCHFPASENVQVAGDIARHWQLLTTMKCGLQLLFVKLVFSKASIVILTAIIIAMLQVLASVCFLSSVALSLVTLTRGLRRFLGGERGKLASTLSMYHRDYGGWGRLGL